MKIWNKAAICKLLWCLAQKKERTWIRWIHGYYIKERDINTVDIPMQCSWMVKKIIGDREYLRGISGVSHWLMSTSLSIRQVYKALLGEPQRVEWERMVSQNIAPPKCVFVSWLLMHERLATCTYLQQMGIMVEPTCCLCEDATEGLDHLFFGCPSLGRCGKR